MLHRRQNSLDRVHGGAKQGPGPRICRHLPGTRTAALSIARHRFDNGAEFINDQYLLTQCTVRVPSLVDVRVEVLDPCKARGKSHPWQAHVDLDLRGTFVWLSESASYLRMGT